MLIPKLRHQVAEALRVEAEAIKKLPLPHPFLLAASLLRFCSKNQRHSSIRLGSWNVGSLCGRGVEVCEELRKMKVYSCGSQEVRWKNKGTRFFGVFGRRNKIVVVWKQLWYRMSWNFGKRRAM